MPKKTVRPVEIDPDTALWLDRLDEDPDDLVNHLLRRYRDAGDDHAGDRVE